MAAFDAGSIEATVRASRDQFNADLDAAKADAARAVKDPVNFKLTADPAAALADIAKVQAAKDKAAKDASFKLSADAAAAKTDLDAVQAKKDKAGQDVSFTVEAKTAAANADLDKTALKADALGRKTETVKVKADTSDASKGLSDLKKNIDGATAAFPLLATAIVGLGPAAVPVLGVVTAAVLPLTAAVGSAVVGLGAFGLLAKSALTTAAAGAKAAQTAQTAYTGAIAKASLTYQQASAVAKTHAQQVAALTAYRKADAAAATAQSVAVIKAYANMSPAQIALSKQVGNLENAWQNVQKATTPLISGALLPWMKAVTSAMQFLKPLVTPVAAVFKDWGNELNTALAGNTAKISAFIAGFAGRSADNIRNFGDALVFFAKGAGALIHDIAPNLGGASLAIARLAASFDGWAHSQKTAADIQGFFAWVKTETPGVEKFLTTLAASLGNLLKAMAVTGGGDLAVLTTALGAIAALPPGVIAALADAYVALSLGLRAASGAIVVWNGVSAVAKTIQAALNTEVKATGVALALQTVITLAQAAATAVVDLAETVYIALMLAADAASLPLIVVIGAVVLAIAALGIGIYELVTHWHDVEEVALAVWHGILVAVEAVWNWIKGNWPLLVGILLGPIATAAALIYLHWNTVKGIFSDVIDWITGHWKLLLVILTGPVGLAALWIAAHWAGITHIFSDVIDWLSTHWKLLLVILTGPVGLAALWLVHAWAGIHNDIDSAWNAIAAFFVGWWNAQVAKWTGVVRTLESVLSAAWNAVSSAARAAWGAIAAFFTSWWNSEVAYFRGPVAAIGNALKAAWTAIETAVRTAWGAIASFFVSWWNSEVAAFRGPVAAIASFLSAAWNGIASVAKSVFGGILSFFGGFWAALKAGFADAVGGIKAAWTAIQNVVKAPVDWVIRYVYDDLIVKFWNDVAGPVGLPTLKGLAEGGIVPGGYSRDDNQLVWMRSGEGVLQPGAVAALGGRGFIDWANAAYGDVPVSASSPGHYAGGGLHIPNPLPAIGHAIVAGAKTAVHAVTDVGGFFGSLVNDVKNGIYDGLAAAGGAIISTAAKAIPGSSGVADAMRAYPLKLWDGFAAWVTGHGPGPPAAAAGYKPGAPASGSAAAAQAFARSILPAGWSWPALVSLWNQESGWNDMAVNASSGAYGIPQALGKGHPYNLGDYANQVRWGISYIAGRYGDSQAAWAHEVANNWYDNGGWLQPGVTMVTNATGRPEPVLSPEQWDSLSSAAGGNAGILARLDRLIRATEQAPASVGYHVGGAINGAASAASFRSRYPRGGS